MTTERLTPDEARDVELPANPIRRLIELQEMAGRSLEDNSPFVLTRNGLVKAAIRTENIADQLAWYEEIRNQSDFTQEGEENNG